MDWHNLCRFSFAESVIGMTLNQDLSVADEMEIDRLKEKYPVLRKYFGSYADKALDDAFNNGRRQGKFDAIIDMNEVFDDGYATGREEGEISGFRDGYDKGHSDGYHDGYEDGKRDATNETIETTQSSQDQAG